MKNVIDLTAKRAERRIARGELTLEERIARLPSNDHRRREILEEIAFQERIKRLQKSIERINQLMDELRSDK